MRKSILVDYTKCTGCRLCALVCSLTKTRTCNPVRARIRIADWKEKGLIVPIVCQDCEEPVCMASCSVNAITRNQETGAVELQRDLCNNCKTCMKVCPSNALKKRKGGGVILDAGKCFGCKNCLQECTIGAIFWDEEMNKPVICVHCGVCVNYCPYGVLKLEKKGDD